LATRRGVRSISTDDLIFLIRHDKAKVSRLRTFLSWKDVRKNVKDSDDKGGGDAADFAAADDAAGVVAGPQDVAPKPKNKRAKVGLAWDVNSFYSVQVPEREDEEDEEEEEQNYATLQRLAAADERTRNMTREEYVFWSECRQASFTYRKSKRFREWAGFGIVTESKPNDDIVDILGFLTFEIVQTLTEQALKVKEAEDNEKHRRGGAEAGENLKKRKRETGLFDPPEEGRTPIEPRHVREAYRKLQATPQKSIAMLLHNGRVPPRQPLALVSHEFSLYVLMLTNSPDLNVRSPRDQFQIDSLSSIRRMEREFAGDTQFCLVWFVHLVADSRFFVPPGFTFCLISSM
jgi:transcription initiation protein SPT3